MPQVVYARRAVATAINPAELLAQLLEDAVSLPIANGLPEQLSACGDEERHLGRGAHMVGALRSVAG